MLRCVWTCPIKTRLTLARARGLLFSGPLREFSDAILVFVLSRPDFVSAIFLGE
jgi:hypothetical protein